jgi:hypothetical protein
VSSTKVYLRGGLGNQLFQYAFGLDISKRFGRKLVLSEALMPKSPDLIGGVSRWPNQIAEFAHSGEIKSSRHQPKGRVNVFGKLMAIERSIGDKWPGILPRMGILANEKYFPGEESSIYPNLWRINSYCTSMKVVTDNLGHLESEILSILNPSHQYQRLKNELIAHRPIALHLRLGDYLGLEHVYGSLGSPYFGRALSKTKDTSRPIWIFTQNGREIPGDLLTQIRPTRIIDEELLTRPIENLGLLAQAETVICSNSSFSWWAAILMSTKKTVIFPRFRNRTNVFSTQMTKSNWVCLDVE